MQHIDSDLMAVLDTMVESHWLHVEMADESTWWCIFASLIGISSLWPCTSLRHTLSGIQEHLNESMDPLSSTEMAASK